MTFAGLLGRLFHPFGILLIAEACLCQAQVTPTHSQLRGKVLDPARAAVMGARIAIEGRDHRLTLSALSDQNGDFLLPLEPGAYIVSVTAEGFAETSQTFNLKPDYSGTLEIVLQIAGSSASVTVTD